MALIGLVRGVSVMVRRYFNFMGAMLTQRTWRLAVVDRYLDAPLSFYRTRSAGELLAHADALVYTNRHNLPKEVAVKMSNTDLYNLTDDIPFDPSGFSGRYADGLVETHGEEA